MGGVYSIVTITREFGNLSVTEEQIRLTFQQCDLIFLTHLAPQ